MFINHCIMAYNSDGDKVYSAFGLSVLNNGALDGRQLSFIDLGQEKQEFSTET